MIKNSQFFGAICALFLHVAVIFFLIFKFENNSDLEIEYSSANNIIQAKLLTVDAHEPSVETVVQNNIPQEIPATHSYFVKKKIEKHIKKRQIPSLDNHDLQKEIGVIHRTSTAQNEIDKQLSLEKNGISAKNKHINQNEISKYKALIIGVISRRWVIPDSANKNMSCIMLINVAPGGFVIDTKIIKSSGNAELDKTAKNAILASSPLPVPDDHLAFENFKVIKLTMRPENIMSMGVND